MHWVNFEVYYFNFVVFEHVEKGRTIKMGTG